MSAASLVGEWLQARAELQAVERAAHPAITDRFGRVWTWKIDDLYTHDGTLCFPSDMIASAGLPSTRCADNPNYANLCDICRSEWR